MRVISGTLKGKRLFSTKGLKLRPTSDRVRESIFDILQHEITGTRVLDLFAGTGALGIEALSRGGERAVFVEKSSASLNALKKNIALCGLETHTEILPKEVPSAIKALETRRECFNLIFLDPPYAKGLAYQTLEILGRSSIVAPGGLIVAEHAPTEPLDGFRGLEAVDRRKYGGTLVSFFRQIRTEAETEAHPIE